MWALLFYGLRGVAKRWLLPLALPICATPYGTVPLRAYLRHPNQRLKKEFRCQFHTRVKYPVQR
jgi:hypothetical protein